MYFLRQWPSTAAWSNYAAEQLKLPLGSHRNQLIRTEFFNTHACYYQPSFCNTGNQETEANFYRIDNLVLANTMDATTAIRFKAGRVFPAFAAILIPANVPSKKSARLSMSV